MINKLIENLKKWNLNNANGFHGDLLVDNVVGRYIWEFDDNGFFIYRDIGSYYFSNDGKIYILTKWASMLDCEAHAIFYELTRNDDNCRIDIPIAYRSIIIDNANYVYKEFLRPNKEYGRDYHLDLFNGNVNNDYFRKFIDDSTILIRYLNKINKEFNIQMPEVGLTVFKRLVDSKGHFWIDFKRWNLDYTKFIDRSLEDLNNIIFYIESNNLGKFNREDLVKEAKEKWNSV
jgi:hypothetical protein